MLVILMIIYQYILILCDVIHLNVMMIWYTLQSLFRVFFQVEKKSISGQIALVTGAGHGIGRELSLQLARLGARVVCLDINEANNQDTVDSIKGEAGIAFGYKCDVSNKDEVKKVMQTVRREVGDVYLLINNAGIMPCKKFLKHSSEEVESLFGVNVFAHFWALQEWLPVFMSRGTGHIVALSSIAGILGVNHLVPYCSTKYAIRGLMDGLKEELRYDNCYPGINLTVVHPFIVDTGLAKKARVRFPSLNPITPPFKAAEIIIDGLLRNEYHVSIPTKDFYFFKLCSIMPQSVQHAIFDFVDAVVDEHED